MIGPETIAATRALGRERGLLTAVDSQGDLAQFAGLDLVKCNQAEAETAVGRRLDTAPEIERAGRELLAGLDSRYVVLTRGAAGLSVFERDAPRPTCRPRTGPKCST